MTDQALTGTDLRTALRDWVRGKTTAAFTDSSPLFAERHLRSLHVPELLLLLERLRGSPVDVEALSPGDLRDIDTIVAVFGAPS